MADEVMAVKLHGAWRDKVGWQGLNFPSLLDFDGDNDGIFWNPNAGLEIAWWMTPIIIEWGVHLWKVLDIMRAMGLNSWFISKLQRLHRSSKMRNGTVISWDIMYVFHTSSHRHGGESAVYISGKTIDFQWSGSETKGF